MTRDELHSLIDDLFDKADTLKDRAEDAVENADDKIEEATAIVQECMQTPPPLPNFMPLVAEAAHGKRYGQLRE